MAQQLTLDNKSINFAEEMRSSFLDYSMSVIMSRALPDARDGLKPVQRRVLYAMLREGLKHDGRFAKCAGVVGEVLKNYHPHGDASVYDTLVRMIQDWVLRYPLVIGQGNFGSIDGDSPAAYRYTESKLSAVGQSLMADLDLGTVDFQDNYNNTTVEPTVMPASIPNLLVNGCTGIAVGMATNIPPHNLGEVIDACLLAIDFIKEGEDVPVKALRKALPGPDFPTGGVILGREGIDEAYETGKGSITIRGIIKEETTKNDKALLVVTEIPYYTSKAKIIEKIAHLVRDKKLDGISDLRDESDQSGIRIAIELKKGTPVELLKEKLFKLTLLQQNFSINMVALDGVQPKLMNVAELIQHFLAHRKVVVERRVKFQLDKLKNRLHIATGLSVVLDAREEYLKKILPAAQNKASLKQVIEKRFDLDTDQSEAVVQLANYRFTKDEYDNILKELAELRKEADRLVGILKSPEKIWNVIREELTEVRNKYGDKRRTSIQRKFEAVDTDTLIPDHEVVIAATADGFIKRYLLDSEKSGEEGKSRLVMVSDEPVIHQALARNHDLVLAIGNQGSIAKIKAHEIPELRRYGKGVAIAEVVKFKEDEKLVTLLAGRDLKGGVMLVSEQGQLKYLAWSDIVASNRGVVSGVRLKDKDLVVSACYVASEKSRLGVVNRSGKILTFESIPRGEKADGTIHLDEPGWLSVGELTARGALVVLVGDGRLQRFEVPGKGKPPLKSYGKDLVAVGFAKSLAEVVVALGSRGEKLESMVKDLKVCQKATDTSERLVLSGNSKPKVFAILPELT